MDETKHAACRADLTHKLAPDSTRKAWLEGIWQMDIPHNMLEDMVRHGQEWFVTDEYPSDYDVYQASVEDFVKAIRGEKKIHVSGQTAKDDVALILAAYESDKTNTVVRF